MASKTLFMTLLIAAFANATFPWGENNENHPNNIFKNGFPFNNFPKLNFPPLVFPKLPPIQPIVFPKIPKITPDDITKGGQDGSNYNGVFVSSHSSSGSNNGKPYQTGETSVITNNNGVVKEFHFNDAPGNDAKSPPFPTDNILRDFEVPSWNPEITFDNVDIKQYKPEQNEQFHGSSFVYQSASSNINGVKNGGAVANIVYNDNGKVVEKTLHFDKDNQIQS